MSSDPARSQSIDRQHLSLKCSQPGGIMCENDIQVIFRHGEWIDKQGNVWGSNPNAKKFPEVVQCSRF